MVAIFLIIIKITIFTIIMKPILPTLTFFSLAVLACMAGYAQESIVAGAEFCPDEIAPITAPFEMPALQRPVFPDRSVDISRLGARQGVLCTRILQRAIDRVSSQGGGSVIIPEGEWLTGRIMLRDNVNLHLEKDAVLRFSNYIKDYQPAVLTRNEGIEMMSLGAMIYASGAENIAITGKGTLVSCARDSSEIWKREYHGKIPLERQIVGDTPMSERYFDGDAGHHEGGVLLPLFFQPVNCRNVLVEGVTFKDAIFWNIVPTYCDGVIIRGVTVDSRGSRTDGIDIESTRNVLIEYCTLGCGDDTFTMKAGRGTDGLRVNRPTENVVVRHSVSLRGPGGLTAGTETSGFIRRIYCHDCIMVSPSYAFYFKTRRPRGGGVEDVYAENIHILNVKNAVYLDELGSTSLYGDLAKRAPAQPVGPLTPVYRNISLKNITIDDCSTLVRVKSLPEMPLTGFTIDNMTATCGTSFVLWDVKDMTVSNSRITMRDPQMQMTDCGEVKFVNTVFTALPDAALGE